MKRRLLLTGILVLVVFSAAWAQQKISGRVTDDKGNPVPVATIQIMGTANGTTADAEGHFTITATPGQTLEVTSIGFIKKEVKVPESGSLDITLQSNTNTLNEMVVTALGIKREKRAIGYSAQVVSGETLSAIKEPNLTNDLTGKVAGLQVVRGGGGVTGSSKIVLRGYNSLTGSNQPLIVVDGIPYDNFTGMSNNDFWNPSLDMGNGLSDLDADNIASITVLKGPSAASLYGSRAGNGVILITTKTGQKQKGIGIDISSSIGFESIFTHPKMQNTFGQGTLDQYNVTSNLSWGPKADGQMVTSWNGKQVPLKTYDNLGNYFQTGVISNQHIAFSQQYGETSIYTSYSRMDDKGLDPSVKLARNNLMARAITHFGASKKWTLSTKLQYINSVADNRPQTGFARPDLTFYTMYTMPRSVNILDFKNPVDSAGKMIWYNTGNVYNPYWDAKYKLNTDARNRYMMYGTLQYDFTSWLNAKIEGGSDMFTVNTESKTYAGSPADNSYGVGKNTYSETNYSTLITAQKNHLFGKWGGTVSLGGNLMNQKSSSISGSASTLVVPNLFTLGNSEGNPGIGYGFSQKKINSVYGTLEISYDDYLYLTGTFRNDWSSALSKANRSYMYPSISLSYVFTDMISNMGGDLPSWITYGKFRASYAAAGNDLDPYQLYNTYIIGKDPNSNTTASPGSVLYNPNVKSELIKSWELGLNMRFLQNRVGFDLSVYQSNATRQLINLPMDPLSGYSAMKINAGNIQNKGVELMVDAKILDNPNGFSWDVSGNFSTNNNTIKALYGDVTSYGLGGFDVISVNAVVGKKYGEIFGSAFERVTDQKSPYYGQLILQANGLPQATSAPVDLGNQQPNALMGFTTNFAYKNFGLSVSLDGSFGGKMFSGTLEQMEVLGTSPNTVVNGARDSLIVAGVIPDGNGGYTKNTQLVSMEKYWHDGIGVGNTGITEANLYNATNVRIRNIQLSYTFPRKILARTPFQKASIALSCNNVWMLKSYMNGLDPESSYATGTNAVGFESGSAPTMRTFYIAINLGF
ncbi:MAG: SusC/RagA family TonB-linked outer membrane protein [Chitinophagaceae bacterium]|nr:MAG: SusC/RagA family TonB-linked outer membrane protein [Chitinophagaceae bacterium]